MGLGGGQETSSFVSDFLEKCGGYAVLDGGFATELERHGADLNDPLWSAKCLISSPHLVRRIRTRSSLILIIQLHQDLKILDDDNMRAGSLSSTIFVNKRLDMKILDP